MQKWLSKIKYTHDKNYSAVFSFLNYKNPFIKRVAIGALAESGSKLMAERFLRMYSAETGLQTRLALLNGLAKLKIKVSTKPIHKKLSDKTVSLSLSELKIGYRTLGKIGARAEAKYLVNQFQRYKNNYPQFVKYEREMKQELIAAIGHIGGDYALKFFSRATEKGSNLSNYRRDIIKAVSGIKVRGADSLVIALSKNKLNSDIVDNTLAVIGVEKKNISYVVSKATKMFDNGKDIYLLLRSLKKHHYNNYKHFLSRVLVSDKIGFNSLTVIAEILTKYTGVEFIPKIIVKLKRVKDLQVMSILVRLLGDLGSNDAVTILKKYLKHDAPGISFLASEALKKITGKEYKSNQFGQ